MEPLTGEAALSKSWAYTLILVEIKLLADISP